MPRDGAMCICSDPSLQIKCWHTWFANWPGNTKEEFKLFKLKSTSNIQACYHFTPTLTWNSIKVKELLMSKFSAELGNISSSVVLGKSLNLSEFSTLPPPVGKIREM